MKTINEKRKLLDQLRGENNEQIKNFVAECEEYLKSLNYEVVELKGDEKVEEVQDNVKKCLQTMNDVNKRREELYEKYKEVQNQTMTELLEFINDDETEIGEQNNDLIDKIIEMKQKEMEAQIKPYQDKINEIEQKYKEQRKGWEETRDRDQAQFEEYKKNFEKYCKGFVPNEN